MALVAILPVDLHAGPGRLLYAHTRRLGCLARERTFRLLLGQPLCFFFADETNAFVAHTVPLLRIRGNAQA